MNRHKAKETLKQASEALFPGIVDSYNFKSKSEESRLGEWRERTVSNLDIWPKTFSYRSKIFIPGHEIVSDLPLQMSLYFNVIYFPFWLVIAVVVS